MGSYEEKREALLGRIAEYALEDMIIAFSGGVDSSLLLKLASSEDRQESLRNPASHDAAS